MKERPILFKGEMVRAIIDGRKTQTRRIVKLEGFSGAPVSETSDVELHDVIKLCPHGQPGDHLWVKETSALDCGDGRILYRADGDDVSASLDGKWVPSLYMRRENSRITLEITGVRCERLQAISEADCYAEAIPKPTAGLSAELTRPSARMQFQILWESIHGPGSWALNPWLWVIDFRKL